MDGDRFDLVVIGCGPAGEKGANQAAYFGHRVAVVDRRALPGGAAVAVSGVPVKALRDAAVELSGWARRDAAGVAEGLAPDLTMARLRDRVRDVISTMTAAVGENLRRHGIELVHGEARLGADRTVIVRDGRGEERALEAKAVLLAPGSRPFHPVGVSFDDPDVHDSETLMSIERLPQQLVVVGCGPVGCEYASIFAALGVQVTMVDRGHGCCHCWTASCRRRSRSAWTGSACGSCSAQASRTVERDAEGLIVQQSRRRSCARRSCSTPPAGWETLEGLDLDAAGVERTPAATSGRPPLPDHGPGVFAPATWPARRAWHPRRWNRPGGGVPRLRLPIQGDDQPRSRHLHAPRGGGGGAHRGRGHGRRPRHRAGRALFDPNARAVVAGPRTAS